MKVTLGNVPVFLISTLGLFLALLSAQLGETGLSDLEVADGLVEALGLGGGEADEGRGAERREGVGDELDGEGVEFRIAGDGTGSARGINGLEEKLGEEVRLMDEAEAGAEAVEARGERAEDFHAVNFPMAHESEALINRFGGFVGEGVERGPIGAGGDEEVAEGIALDAAGLEADVGEDGIGGILRAGDRQRGHGGGAGVGGARRGEQEQSIGEIHPRGREVDARRAVFGDGEFLQDGDGFLVGEDGGGQGGGVLLGEGVAAVQPRSTEAVAKGGIESREFLEEPDGLVIAGDGVGEAGGRADFLQGVAAVHPCDTDIAAVLRVG